MDSPISNTSRRYLCQSLVLDQQTKQNGNEIQNKTIQLQQIQNKHQLIKLEKENRALQEKVSELISQQFKNQKVIVDQKQQIINISNNLYFLSASIKEDDSPIKKVIQKLLDSDQSPGNYEKPLDIELQIQMNELQRQNKQLKQQLQAQEEKIQNYIQRQFVDAANILKLRKDKSSLTDKLNFAQKSVEGKKFDGETASVQVIISDLYSDIQNQDKIKEKFQALIQNFLILCLTQQSNSLVELGDSIVKTHRSSSSKKIDQIWQIFNDIMKFGNLETQRFKESAILTQENQIYESFIQEKCQTCEKQTQTMNLDLSSNDNKKKNRSLLNTTRVQTAIEYQNAESQTDEIEQNQQQLFASFKPLLLSDYNSNFTSDNANTEAEKDHIFLKAGNEQGHLLELIDQLTVQLNYTKNQYFIAVDKFLLAQEELNRLNDVEGQLHYLTQQHLFAQKDLDKYKFRYQELLDKYFQLEQTSKGQQVF